MGGLNRFCRKTLFHCCCYLFIFIYSRSLLCAHMDAQATPHTEYRPDQILSHQTSSHCHLRPMGFISASFKTTTLIPTPTH